MIKKKSMKFIASKMLRIMRAKIEAFGNLNKMN